MESLLWQSGLLLAPEGNESDGDGDGSDDGAAGDAAAGGGDGGDGASDGAGSDGDSSDSGRPSWLPEEEEDPDAYVEKLKGDYDKVKQQAYTRTEKLKDIVRGEMEAERREKAPAKADDYELNLPKAVEEAGITINTEDPLFNWFRNMAHERGLEQTEFDEIMAGYIDNWIDSQPKWDAVEAELGEHAERRQERVDTWLHQNLSDETFDEISKLPVTPGIIKVFEELMEATGAPSFNPEESSYRGQMDETELAALQGSDAYWNQSHPDHEKTVKRVQAGWAKIRNKGR